MSDSSLAYSFDFRDRNDSFNQKASGHIEEKDGKTVITVNARSHFAIFFENGYRLEIDDLRLFKKLSSQVPPFMLMPYLAKKGVTTFDDTALSEKDIELLLKLNEPKFYRSKNVEILCMGNKNSDMRMIGHEICDIIPTLFMSLELTLKNRLRFEKYLTTKEVLKELRIDDALIEDLVSLRNFAAHDGVIGNCVETENGVTKISPEWIIRILDDLTLSLERMEIQKKIVEKSTKQIIDKILSIKYRAYYEASCKLFYEREFDYEKLTKIRENTERRNQNSYVSSDLENYFLTRPNMEKFTFYAIRLKNGSTSVFHYNNLEVYEIKGNRININDKEIPGPTIIFLYNHFLHNEEEKYPWLNKLVLESERREGIITTKVFSLKE